MEKNAFVPFLYESSTIPEALKKYEVSLRKSKDIEDILHANKLEEYRNVIVDKKFLSTIRKIFNRTYSMIEKNYPNLKFYLEGRRKAAISTEKKNILYLSKNKSLDDFRDLLAFRIILFGDDHSMELIETAYSLMKNLIDFMILQGFTPCEATEVFETEGFSNEDLNILVPDHSFLEENYKHLVKDYIVHPKKNGYQSLHVAFRDVSGKCFEVQIRTLAMHMLAESSDSAGHDFYKQKRYSDADIVFDRTQIHMEGYGVMSEHVFDFIGLESGLSILQRQKTF